jgi:hypothetical protein
LITGKFAGIPIQKYKRTSCKLQCIYLITIPSDEGINVFPRCGTDQVLPEYQDNLSQELGSVVCRIPDNGFKGIPDNGFQRIKKEVD